MPPSQQLKPGEVINGLYRVVAKIGEGGMGQVYKVEHMTMARHLALKTFQQDSDSDRERQTESWKRFQNEARTIARLNHRSIIHVYDFGVTTSGTAYYLMDFIEGKTLSERIREHGQLEMREALAVFIEVAQGLAYAHSQGLVHRDIKPSNIMLSSDAGINPAAGVKIVDFGLVKSAEADPKERAKAAANAVSTNVASATQGSPPYMSPEQFQHKDVDYRSDIYSFGCTLFEGLTGVPPFISDSALVLSMKHCTEAPPSLGDASLGREFPNDLELIQARLLAKAPGERYQHMQVVAEDLQGVLNELDQLDRQALEQNQPATGRTGTVKTTIEATPEATTKRIPVPMSQAALSEAGNLADSQNVTVSPLAPDKLARRLLLLSPVLLVGAGLAIALSLGWKPNLPGIGSTTPPAVSDKPANTVKTTTTDSTSTDSTTPTDSTTAHSAIPFDEGATVSKKPYSDISVDAKGQQIRHFRFPTNICLGRLIDKDSNNAFGALAQGDVSFPVRTHLRLVPSIALCASPSYFRRFRPDDLDEVCMSKNETVTSETLNFLDHLSSLTVVSLFETEINDECVQALEQFPALIALDISNTNMTGEGVAKLKNLKSIRFLRVNEVAKVSTLLPLLQKYQTIEGLHVDGTLLTSEDQTILTSIKSLKELSVSATNLNSAGLEILRQCPNLEELVVDANGLRGNSLPYFQKFPKLKTLRLNCDSWSPAEIAAFKAGLPKVNIIVEDPY